MTIRYLFVSLMLYGWSIIPFIYIQSFLFKVASTAYNYIMLFNIFTGKVQLILPFI